MVLPGSRPRDGMTPVHDRTVFAWMPPSRRDDDVNASASTRTIVLSTRSVAFMLAPCFALAVTPAAAQTYPTKPVRYVVPFPAGGSPDIIARLITERFTKMWGQQVLVENRAGAGGTVGAAYRGEVGARRLHALPVQHRFERDRAVALREDAVRPPARLRADLAHRARRRTCSSCIRRCRRRR